MNNIIERLRENLQPAGDKPLVRLKINGIGMYEQSFVDACVTEVEKRTKVVVSGLDTLSPLEVLAIEVLLDSADIIRP